MMQQGLLDEVRALLAAGIPADCTAMQAIGYKEAVAAVRKAGFKNLSMDLIYGLPGQTMQQWEDTLAAVIALAPEHISCYGLKLEPGTPLYDRRDSECFPDDDAQADMYLYAVTVLAQNGYELRLRPGPGQLHKRSPDPVGVRV